MLSEADIIANLAAAFKPGKNVIGIGDDAAVLPLNTSENYVISKDILIEHKHFRLNTTDAASLAHKALHVNLSDIAAMGTEPLFVLLGIALPASLEKKWIEQFLAGFTHACVEAKVQLIGGDTTASDRDVIISITVIGRGEKAQLKFRNDAKQGDSVCVAGVLGEAHAGLVALEKNVARFDNVKAKSLRPVSLVAEGHWLGTQSGVTAMMDVSDGLVVDLGKLLEASKAGAVIDVQALKSSTMLSEACTALKLDARTCMLAGGEDYALLFTVKADVVEIIAAEFEKKFGYTLMQIGAVTSSGTLELRENGKPYALRANVFSHFGEL